MTPKDTPNITSNLSQDASHVAKQHGTTSHTTMLDPVSPEAIALSQALIQDWHKVESDVRTAFAYDSEFHVAANSIWSKLGREFFVLVLIYYRYLSTDITNYFNQLHHQAGDQDFNYEQVADQDLNHKEVVESFGIKGYFIPPSALFNNLLATLDDCKDIHQQLEKTFRQIEWYAGDNISKFNLKGLIYDSELLVHDNFGSNTATRNKCLSSLLQAVAQVPLENYQQAGIMAFSQICEHLVDEYYSQTEWGKPFSLTSMLMEGCYQLMAKIATMYHHPINGVYDPCCVYGKLLTAVATQAKAQQIKVFKGYFGQATKTELSYLARMNLHLHGINYDEFMIATGDSIVMPDQTLQVKKPYDIIVSDLYPYLDYSSAQEQALLDFDYRHDTRFEEFAEAEQLIDNPELAYYLHAVANLSDTGRAVLLVSLEALNSKLGANLLHYLITHNLIDSVISLPELREILCDNPAILVLSKQKTDKQVLFIDPRDEVVQYNKHRQVIIRPEVMSRVITALTQRTDVPGFCRMVSPQELAKTRYSLKARHYLTTVTNPAQHYDIATIDEQIARSVDTINQLQQQYLAEKAAVYKQIFNKQSTMNTLERTLGSMVDFCEGESLPGDSVVQFTSAEAAQDQTKTSYRIFINGSLATGRCQYSNCDAGTILINLVNRTEPRIFMTREACWIGRGYVRLVPDPEQIDKDFLYTYLVQHRYIIEELAEYNDGFVSVSDLWYLPIFVPDTADQLFFASYFKQWRDQAQQIIDASATLSELQIQRRYYYLQESFRYTTKKYQREQFPR